MPFTRPREREKTGFACTGADVRTQGGNPGKRRALKVIVGAKFQPLDAAIHLIARSQEQDRGLPGGAPHFAQNSPAIDPGKHHVEYDEIITFRQRQMQPVSPISRDIGHEASFGQSFLRNFSVFGSSSTIRIFMSCLTVLRLGGKCTR